MIPKSDFNIGTPVVNYTFKIEVECSMFDGMYGWSLFRKENECTDDWTVLAIGNANTEDEAFDQARVYKDTYIRMREVLS